MAEEDRSGPQHAGDPGAPADDARPSHLPERVRGNPLFRRGYALGYRDRAHEEHLADVQGGRRLFRGGSPESPAAYGVCDGGLRDRLVPGTRVIREVLASAGRERMTEVPCCGRRVTILVLDEEPGPAACCRCGVTYAAEVTGEEPDGYGGEPLEVAVFTVERVRVAIARHRAGRWEPALGPPQPGGG